jgi:uncharacterized protein (TIRG00374 family)
MLKKFKILISLAISIILIYFLLTKINLIDIYALLKESDTKIILSAFILYLIIYATRALRFRYLLNKEVSYSNLFPVVCIHNFLNMALPLKTGEISYSYLLKKSSQISFKKSISNILIARLMDLGGIAFLFFLSLGIYIQDTKFKFLLITLSWISLAAMFFTFFFISKLKFISKIKVKNPFFIKLKEFILEVINESTSYKKINIIIVIGISIAINSFMFIFGYLLMLSFGVSLSIWAIFVGGTLAFFITIIPIQGLFNFGTLEAAWTVSYMLVGLSKEQAIATGFGYHLINLAFTIIMALLGFSVMAITKMRYRNSKL